MKKNILIGILVFAVLTLSILLCIETKKEPKEVEKIVTKEVEKKIVPSKEEKELVGIFKSTTQANSELVVVNSIHFFENNKFLYYESGNSETLYFGEYNVKNNIITLSIDWKIASQSPEIIDNITLKVNNDGTLSKEDIIFLKIDSDINESNDFSELFRITSPNKK